VTANFGLAPRNASCWVCNNVTHPEDVTVRLIGSEGEDLPTKEAADYVRSIGHAGPSQSLTIRLKKHRDHVRRFIVPDSVIAPIHRIGTPMRTAPAGGPPAWIRVHDQAIDLAESAADSLAAQLDDLSPEQKLGLMRIGISSAKNVGDWHAKGRQMDQFDDLMRATFEANRAERG
jgi:hypothetical protein